MIVDQLPNPDNYQDLSNIARPTLDELMLDKMAEREAVDLSWTQRVYNALVRGRYASHAERNRRALLRGTEVTVFGRATTDESGESGGPGVCVRPDR